MNGWAFETLAATTVLLGLVMLLRNSVARAFGPRTAYALWTLPALRLVMPSLPGWRLFYVPVVHLHGAHFAAGLLEPARAARLANEDAAAMPIAALTAPIHADPIQWQSVLFAVWLGGALLWFVWQMLRYRRFLRNALRSSVLMANECGVDLLVSPKVHGPVAAGVIKRRIFLPTDFMTRYTRIERHLALLHEGAHHDRRDVLANFVALVVLSLHWWNPLAHRAYRLFRADQELACDATVLVDVRVEDRHAYGSAIVKSVAARMPGVACALSHKNEIKYRLRRMAAPRIGVRRLRTGAVVAIAAIGGGLVVTASSHATAVEPETNPYAARMGATRPYSAPASRAGLRAAQEGSLGAAEGRRVALASRRSAALERAVALRHAAHVKAVARFAAASGRAEALSASQKAVGVQQASYLTSDEDARQIAATRLSMTARCAARGRPVPSDLEWSRLALCGDTADSIIARVHAQVRRQLAAEGIAWN